jgi:hypothetical protein
LDALTPARRQSTITNPLGYRALALDFELWAKTRPEIQRAFLDHFATLLGQSRFRAFNARQRLAGMALVRKFLFVLHTAWFGGEPFPALLEALKVAMQTLPPEEALKPVVAYLAANLHDGKPCALLSAT